MHPFLILLVNFFCTLFIFVCSIKCTAGGRTPRRRCILCCRQIEKVCRKSNKHIFSGYIVKILSVWGERVKKSAQHCCTQCTVKAREYDFKNSSALEATTGLVGPV